MPSNLEIFDLVFLQLNDLIFQVSDFSDLTNLISINIFAVGFLTFFKAMMHTIIKFPTVPMKKRMKYILMGTKFSSLSFILKFDDLQLECDIMTVKDFYIMVIRNIKNVTLFTGTT